RGMGVCRAGAAARKSERADPVGRDAASQGVEERGRTGEGQALAGKLDIGADGDLGLTLDANRADGVIPARGQIAILVAAAGAEPATAEVVPIEKADLTGRGRTIAGAITMAHREGEVWRLDGDGHV